MEYYQNAIVNWCSCVSAFTSRKLVWLGKKAAIKNRVYLGESLKNKLAAPHVVFFSH